MIAILCFAMFLVKKEYKLGILFIYTMCFSSVDTNAFLFTKILSPPLFFVISELPNTKQYIRDLKGHTIIKLLSMICIATFIVFVSSKNLQGISGLFHIVKDELLLKYFVILYAYFCVKNINTLKIVANCVFVSVLLLTLFGIHNYVTHHSVFVDWALSNTAVTDVNELAGSMFTTSERFRVQSMHWNPFNYGYMCLAASLLLIYCRIKKCINRLFFLIAMLGCLFGVFTCGARTLLFCALFGYAVYYLLSFKFSKSILATFVISFFVFISYHFIPYFNEKLQSINTLFDDSSSNTSIRGSSIEMRSIQLAAVFMHINGHVLLGRGYWFFLKDLGYQDGRSGLVDEDLRGLEGIYLNLLLERGVIGLMFYIAFWGILLVYIIKKRKLRKDAASLCISMLFVYLLFAIMTGELKSVFITMLILGCGIHLLDNNDVNNIIKDKVFKKERNNMLEMA